MRKLNPERRPSCQRIATSLVSVSVADAITTEALRAALGNVGAPHQPAARRLMEEAPAPLLAGLVAEGFIDWRTLAEAAERYPPANGTWPASRWPELFATAAALMDLLPAGGAWSFGGGTCLALRYGHRISYDVDIFVTDAQLIPFLSPRLNDAAASLVPAGEPLLGDAASRIRAWLDA